MVNVAYETDWTYTIVFVGNLAKYYIYTGMLNRQCVGLCQCGIIVRMPEYVFRKQKADVCI